MLLKDRRSWSLNSTAMICRHYKLVFETNACQFELLPEIIKRATSNSLFIFLDPHQKTLNAIIALLGRLEEEEKEKGDNNNIEELHGGEDNDEEVLTGGSKGRRRTAPKAPPVKVVASRYPPKFPQDPPKIPKKYLKNT